MAQLADSHLHVEHRVGHIEAEVGDLKGMTLEIRYRDRTFAYFARVVRSSNVREAQ
jgi:hypothetical protein